MAIELGLDNKRAPILGSWFKLSTTVSNGIIRQWGGHTSDTPEERRTWLGCYFLTAQ